MAASTLVAVYWAQMDGEFASNTFHIVVHLIHQSSKGMRREICKCIDISTYMHIQAEDAHLLFPPNSCMIKLKHSYEEA